VRDVDTRVELSLDEVDVVARSRVVDRFVELEAELVKGPEERLASLADVFAADPALTVSTGSKLEAALAALGAGTEAGRPQRLALHQRLHDPRFRQAEGRTDSR